MSNLVFVILILVPTFLILGIGLILIFAPKKGKW